MPPKKPFMSDMVPSRKPSPRTAVKAAHDPAPEPSVISSRQKPSVPEGGRRAASAVLWFIVVLVILALVIAVGGLFSHATVTVHPREYSGSVDTQVVFSKLGGQGSVFFATATRTFEAHETVAPTGVSGVDAAASGTVRAFNSSTARKTIPKGTSITSSKGVVFITDKSVTVPGVSKGVPGQADIPVRARDAGNAGNIGLDDFTLPGFVVKSVTVMSGGTAASDAVADPVLVAAARDRVVARVGDKTVLAGRMAEELPVDMIFLPIDLPSAEPVVAIEPGHADGVHVSARQTVTILMARRGQLAKKLADSLGFKDAGELTIESFGELNIAAPVALAEAAFASTFQARVAGPAVLKGAVDTDALVPKLLGQSRRNARSVLGSMPEIESFSVRMTPPWRRAIPASPSDVRIFMR